MSSDTRNIDNVNFSLLLSNTFLGLNYLFDPGINFLRIVSIEAAKCLDPENSIELKSFSEKSFSILYLNMRKLMKLYEPTGWAEFWIYLKLFANGITAPQLTLTCSKSTTETLKKSMRHVQSQQ